MPRAASALVPPLLLVLGSGLVLQPAPATGEQRQCEVIRVPLCVHSELGYNLTRMPTPLGHSTQGEAGIEVRPFYPLVKARCSENLAPFLCQLYVPECEADGSGAKPPCRELCESARGGCEPLMNGFGILWPGILDCARFPSAAAGEACGLPAGSNLTIVPATAPPEPPPFPTPLTTRPAEPSAAPSEPGCRCGGGSAGSALPELAALEGAVERLVRRSNRLHRLQEETLKMQQQNMRLERQKLEMEIRLLQRRLGGS